MEAIKVDSLLDDLEESYWWRPDVTDVIGELLVSLPATPSGERQRERLTLLGLDDIIAEQGAAAAARAALDVRDRAAGNGHRALQAQAERALSVVFRKIGDSAAALEHAVTALTLDDDGFAPLHRCKLRLAVADALAINGSVPEAQLHYREAFAHAGAAITPYPRLLVLNNWAYSNLVGGDLAAAAELVEQMQTLTERHGLSLMLGAVSTVAEVLHALGRSHEAIDILRSHLTADQNQIVYDVGGCWLTLAVVQREIGALDDAVASLDAADAVLVTAALRAQRVELMGERAELLAARGDHQGAYAMHRRFHAETLELRSDASDARARTLHAIYEIDEARKESARYREMSYRDPLTGLFNRRFVDEDLDRRLARPGVTETPPESTAVILVDLDHFKRVNDTCSHEAGDAVLVRVAEMLQLAAARSDHAYAARLGGEEFLLVLPGLDQVRARPIAETARGALVAQDWTDVAADLPITASFGVAATGGGRRVSRAELLRTADDLLYAAKAGGRNRVEPAAS